MTYHMLQRQQEYQELGSSYLDNLDKQRTARRLIQRLEALGFEISLTERASAPTGATAVPSGD